MLAMLVGTACPIPKEGLLKHLQDRGEAAHPPEVGKLQCFLHSGGRI